jgi:hypothetical protein
MIASRAVAALLRGVVNARDFSRSARSTHLSRMRSGSSLAGLDESRANENPALAINEDGVDGIAKGKER